MLLCLAYISRLTPKCRMICRLTPKSCVMYAGLRLAKTFVCCCPDQLNKRLTDSKNESVRRKSCSVRAKSTFVVASSQSQRVAFMTRSARGGADRYVAGSASIIIIIIIIRQPLCPVVGRRPQHAVSKLPCLVLSSAISCRSSICPGRLSIAWLVSLVVFSCHMVSNW